MYLLVKISHRCSIWDLNNSRVWFVVFQFHRNTRVIFVPIIFIRYFRINIKRTRTWGLRINCFCNFGYFGFVLILVSYGLSFYLVGIGGYYHLLDGSSLVLRNDHKYYKHLMFFQYFYSFLVAIIWAEFFCCFFIGFDFTQLWLQSSLGFLKSL